jgi:alkaline phosphatase D
MKLGRRRFLEGSALVALVGLPAACSSADPAPQYFFHGVASGDPLPDAVILWTRVTTNAPSAVVGWVIAKDPALQNVVKRGSFTTDAERDYTVKIDVTGLDPQTTYYYRFDHAGGNSPIGRTRTAPSGAATRLRFAMVSCASYAHGYFHVYRHVAKRLDLDCVLHLGDYIYEYATNGYGDRRAYEPPNEILSLADYRTRHAQYKRDPDLAEAHRQHPFVCIWDDHEIADNGWREGAENHDPATEGTWSDRRAAAQRAYSEWMPIRDQSSTAKIYRSLRYGDLVELVMLDTRYVGRDLQATSGNDAQTMNDPSRTILGAEQEAWLADRLKTSTSTWKLVGQQVMFGQLPQFLNVDAWDGYRPCRERVLDVIEKNAVKNVVILTGDIHTSWAMDITRDPTLPNYDPTTGAGALAVEIVTPGVSSPGLPLFAYLAESLVQQNRHMRFVDLAKRGYVVLDVTPQRLQAAFWHVEDVIDPALSAETMVGAFSTAAGVSNLKKDASEAPTPEAPPGAPS